MTSHRPARIGDLIQRELSRALRETVRDPRIGFVTLTAVRVSGDLQHARIFVAPPDGARWETVRAALRRATPFLRKCLAQQAGLRLTPQIEFVRDEAIESGMRMERLLEDIKNEREQTPVEEE